MAVRLAGVQRGLTEQPKMEVNSSNAQYRADHSDTTIPGMVGYVQILYRGLNLRPDPAGEIQSQLQEFNATVGPRDGAAFEQQPIQERQGTAQREKVGN